MRTRDAGTSPPGSVSSSKRIDTTVAERTTRIDAKISIATKVLDGLSPTAPLARLLGSAVLRRDEVLLDAVLAEVERANAKV